MISQKSLLINILLLSTRVSNSKHEKKVRCLVNQCNNKSLIIYMKKNRNSNIELLRIIAALFVLSYHAINALELPSRFIMTGLFFGMGRISVNIFVIISAWFLCEQKFKFERITNTWLSTIFYTIPIALVFVYFGKADLVYLITNMFPVFFQPLWFITAYFLVHYLSYL